MTVQDYVDIRTYFTNICDHQCEHRKFSPKQIQGTTIHNSFLGYECTCGEWFRLELSAAKCVRVPMRHYITTTEQRADLADRINTEPQVLLEEMRQSGGWDQPDPGVTLLTVLAAAVGPEGNPAEQHLKAMMAPLPVPPKAEA